MSKKGGHRDHQKHPHKNKYAEFSHAADEAAERERAAAKLLAPKPEPRQAPVPYWATRTEPNRGLYGSGYIPRSIDDY